MFLSAGNAVGLLMRYRYHVLLPIAIVEGPIITVIAGFLVSLGLFNPYLSYGIVIVGDIIGDSFFYILGRWGSGLVGKYGHRVGLTARRMESARITFQTHHGKAITLAKLAQGVGPVGLIAAGSLRIPYRRYIMTCFLVTCCQAAIFLFVGVLFGSAYLGIGRYLNYIAAGITALLLFVLFIILIRKWDIRRN